VPSRDHACEEEGDRWIMDARHLAPMARVFANISAMSNLDCGEKGMALARATPAASQQ
jgi:hypothetical protein